MSDKTKAQIIDETIAHIAEFGRGVDAEGLCTYLDVDTGKMCAVGRCMIDPSGIDVSSNVHALGGMLEGRLKPEYRGHDLEFWYELQLFHDSPSNWNPDNSLSESGRAARDVLRRQWP